MDETYTPSFAGALAALNDGRKVTRKSWNGSGQFLALQVPDAHSKMKRPCIYISPGRRRPGAVGCIQSYLLANDWEVLAAVNHENSYSVFSAPPLKPFQVLLRKQGNKVDHSCPAI